MGKVKKQKATKREGVERKSIEEEETLPDSKENVIQTILDQLQAANVEEKYCGLQTLALLIEGSENVELVLRSGILRATAPLLNDNACSVRNATAGVLRNLSTIGHEACEHLMEQDVMTPLIFYFHEFVASWVPDAKTKSKEDSETVIHCLNIMWNLCESSELALKYLGESKILDILPRYLDLGAFHSDIVVAILQCLLVVVEDNNQAIDKVKSNSEVQLQQLLSVEGDEPHLLLIKTLAAGVIINICGGNIISLPTNIITRLITILAETLSVDHRLICNKVTSTVPLKEASGRATALTGKEERELEIQLKSVYLTLEAQQSSVEIIANLCSCNDNDDSLGESSDSEDMGEDDICNGSSEVTETILAEDKLPPEIIEAMISLEIFNKVLAKAQLPADNVMLILKEYQGSQLIHKKLHTLQTRSLFCINNILSSLPIDNLGGVNGVYKIWVDIGKLVFNQNSDNMSLVESATAVMRAALDKLKEKGNAETGGNLFSDLALSDIEMMVTGIKECQVPEIRSNLIRMIGILALLLVNFMNDMSANVICAITEFILEQAHKENEVWVLAEAIDTLVDLYSEDETDVLAAKIKLVEKLAVLAPILKNKARQQRKLPQEYKVLVNTATSNLPRFIKYKKGRVAKLT